MLAVPPRYPAAPLTGDPPGDRLGLWTYDTRQRLERYYAGESPGRSIQYFDYDPVSRLSGIEHNIPTVADRVTIGLTGYNPAGQIVTRTRSNAAYVFDPPATGTTGYTVNGLNQYDPVNPPGSETTTETYDARGNLTEYDSSVPANDRVYTYDALNRLESARLGGASSPLSRFFYDPLGRLSAVTTGGAGGRRYLWDGDRIVAQYAGGALTVQRRFVHAPGSLGAPVTEYVGASVDIASRRYLQTDERGAVVSVVHADNGATAEINTYGPYGENGAGNGGQFQYAGQLWLPEAGLYYMRNRMYDPALGRFGQTDPIGYAGGMNLYAYVGNDPTNFVDPWGLCLHGTQWESTKCAAIDPDGAIRVTAPGFASPSPLAFGQHTRPTFSGPTGQVGGGGGGGDGGPPPPDDERQRRNREICEDLMAAGNRLEDLGSDVGSIGVDLAIILAAAAPFTQGGSLIGIPAAAATSLAGELIFLGGVALNAAATGDYGRAALYGFFGGLGRQLTNSQILNIIAEDFVQNLTRELDSFRGRRECQ